MHFKIDWVSLIVRRKFTVFALFYFVFEGNFQVQAPGGGGGGLYLERGFKGGFFALRVWGAYIWRGLFLEFYGISCNMQRSGHIQSKPIRSFHKDVLNVQEKWCLHGHQGWVVAVIT